MLGLGILADQYTHG